MPRVVWAEEFKTGLRFEIRPSYDNLPMTSQCVTGGQSNAYLVGAIESASRFDGANES